VSPHDGAIAVWFKDTPANIPPKSNRTEALSFSPYLHRARNLVERFFNKIKHCRRVATRYDKLAANYLAFIQLASIRLWLRINEPATSLEHFPEKWTSGFPKKMRPREGI
jgi:hypothetical protein